MEIEELKKAIKKAEKKLSKPRLAFVNHLLSDSVMEKKHAYKMAYPKSKDISSESNGVRLSKIPVVADYIAMRMELRSIETKVDANYILKRLSEIDQMDVLDIFNNDFTLKSLDQWPKVWRTSISSIDICELSEAFEGKKTLSSVVKKIKWPDTAKNLELLGKHIDVQAFKESIAVEVDELLTPWGSIESGVDE